MERGSCAGWITSRNMSPPGEIPEWANKSYKEEDQVEPAKDAADTMHSDEDLEGAVNSAIDADAQRQHDGSDSTPDPGRACTR
jgi:hypothetical protein